MVTVVSTNCKMLSSLKDIKSIIIIISKGLNRRFKDSKLDELINNLTQAIKSDSYEGRHTVKENNKQQ